MNIMWQTDQLNIAQFAIAEYSPQFNQDGAFIQPPQSFEIKTCQRTLFLYGTSPEINSFFKFANRHYVGIDAYEFLLRFACGLESQIKGETDVFGQLKTAFKNLEVQNPKLAEHLNVIFLKIFEDTKEIRANYLQGIGGNTYGALARRLTSPTESDQILVIGAGDISKSVAPYFAEFSLTIWNRSSQRLNDLGIELAKKGHHPSLITDESDLELAISNSSLIIIGTPFNSNVEPTIAKCIKPNTRVLHLGAQAKETSTLTFNTMSLTDLFEMEREQSEIREKQVRQAIQACHERALLRNLSRSIHAHGWEDLAVFF